MRNPAFKSVRALYDYTVDSNKTKPKITAGLKENSLAEGLENEVDGKRDTMLVPQESSEPGRIDGVYSTSNKPKEAEESRTFNPSGTLCNHVAVDVGEKDDVFPTIATKGKTDGHNFSNGCDVLSTSINSTCSARQITSSETSNLLSLCSSHNSFSENAESKACLGASDLSEEVETLTSAGQSFYENNCKLNQPDLPDDFVSLTVAADPSRKMNGHRIDEVSQKNLSCGPNNSVSPIEEVFEDSSEKKEASSESTLTHFGNLSNQAHMHSERQCSKSVALGLAMTVSVTLDPAMTVRNNAAENSDCENHRESNEKYDTLVGEPNNQLHRLESQNLNSIGESDNESVEVRVCDSCGDVGKEALLVICSNCGDGAEHTYCMPVMLTEAPTDWICEECIMEREKEKLKRDRLAKGEQKFKRTLSLNETRRISENYGRLNSQSCTKLDNKFSGKRRLRKKYCADILSKKSVSALNSVSKTERKTTERHFKSSRVTIPCNKSRSLKNSSTIDLDKWKIKPAYGLTASGQCSSSRTVEGASSSAITGHRAERLQRTPGSLLKSKSFAGTESKVSSQIQREDKVMSKSMSFNRVSSNCLKNSPVKSLKRLRQEKDYNPSQKRHKPQLRNLLPRKPVTGCDPSISKRSPSISSPVIGSSASQLSNEKRNLLMNVPSGLPTSKSDKGSDISKTKSEKINLSKSSEMVNSGATMSKTDKMKLLGNSSLIGSCPPSKTGAGKLLTGSAITGSCGPTSSTYKGKFRPSSPTNDSGGPILKTGSGSLFRSSPPMTTSAPKSNTSVGKLSTSSATGFCVPKSNTGKSNISVSLPMTRSGVSTSTYTGKLLTSSPMSASTLSSSNSSKSIPKVSFPQSASASMTHEKASSMDMRVTKLSSASRCFDTKVAMENVKSNSSFKGERNTIKKGMKYDTNKVFSDRRHDHPSKSVSAVKERILCATSPDKNLSFSISPVITTSNFAAPQFERIWLGEFDIYKCEKLPSFSGGIQAHFSMNASPKAVEAVNKFPNKLLLQEVSRSSIWPTQFSKNQATEDNIALFFFAEDIESFEKTYKNLVQCMVDNDLALKGNFGEFDLLIFTSKLLPERFQRWNKLLFIWGVFRGKSIQFQSSTPIGSSEMMIGIASSDAVSIEKSVDIVETKYKSGKLSCGSEAIQTSNFQKTSRYFTIKQSPTVTPDIMLCGSDAYFQQQKRMKSLGASESRSMTNSPGNSKMLSKVAPESDTSQIEPMEYERDGKMGLKSTSEVKEDYNNDIVRVPGGRESLTNMFSPKLSEVSSSSRIESATGSLAFGRTDIDFSNSGHDIDKTCDAVGYEQERTKVSADSGSIDGMLGVKPTQHSVPRKAAEDQQECGVTHFELSSAKEETYNGVMSPLWDTENQKNDKENPARADSDNKMNIDDEMTGSLSLSLHLPGSSENLLPESNTSRTLPSTEVSGVNTPVYLFGKILKG